MTETELAIRRCRTSDTILRWLRFAALVVLVTAAVMIIAGLITGCIQHSPGATVATPVTINASLAPIEAQPVDALASPRR
jgi:hypothetical protein